MNEYVFNKSVIGSSQDYYYYYYWRSGSFQELYRKINYADCWGREDGIANGSIKHNIYYFKDNRVILDFLIGANSAIRIKWI